MPGKRVSDFSLAATGGTQFTLSAQHGTKLVLYFHPKDNTPGCTAVFGISRGSLSSHERFKEKMRFPFELLSDPVEAVCGQFGVMKLESMYGKKVRGITRSRDRIHGGLALEWRGVKVPGHAQEVLNFVKAL